MKATSSGLIGRTAGVVVLTLLIPVAAGWAADLDPGALQTYTGKIRIAHPTSSFTVLKDPSAPLGHRLGQQIPVLEPDKAANSVEYIYDNAYGFTLSITYTTAYPPHSGEDITLGAGSVPYPGMVINEFGACWVIQPGGAGANAALVVEFYDSFDPNAPLGPPPANVMGAYIGGQGWSFGQLGGGAWCAETLAVSPPVAPADANVFVVQYWLDLNDPTLNTYTENVSPGFQTANPPAVGASPNRYYRDGGTRAGTTPPGPQTPARDNVLASNEAVAFAAPRITNYYMRIGATPNVVTITPGIDLLMTPPGDSYIDFGAAGIPIPGGFFGPGSDPFVGRLDLVGKPIDTVSAGGTDTIVRRLAAFDIDGSGSSATIPIQIAALSLTSMAPITVTYGGGAPEQWNVDVCLSAVAQQQTGSMTVHGGECAGEGGVFTSTLPVTPKFTFTRVSGGASRVLDLGAVPKTFSFQVQGHWMSSLSGGVGVTAVTAPQGLAVDADCDPSTPLVALSGTSNFYPSMRTDRCPGHCDWGVGNQMVRRFQAVAPGIVHGVFWPLTGACVYPDFCAANPGDDIDGDKYSFLQDNCPFVANPDQADFDDDSYGDACDACPLICDTNQIDTDSDGAGDLCDCRPLDPTVKFVPREITGVLTTGNLELSWDDETGYAGSSTVYDVARGDLVALKASGYPGAAVCAANDVALPTYSEGITQCAAGVHDGCWYVVRGRNICGHGTYGTGASVPSTLDPGPCP